MNLKFYTKTMNLLFSFKKALALFIAGVILGGSAFSQVGATALNFDGINDYVTIPMMNNNNAGALNISSAITIEAWISPSKSTGTQDVLCKSMNSPNNAYVFPRTSDGWKTIEFLLNINGYGWKVLKVIYGQAKLNQWHHVAASYDGLKMRIFIDGTQAGEYAFAGSITVNNNPLTIGNQPGFNEYYGGSVDEIRVWNRAVIGCEILNNITCQLGGTQNGLVAYYQFNQGLVNSVNTGISQLNDSGPSLANGTLMNFGYNGLVSNWCAGSSITGTCAVYTPPVVSAGSLQSVVPLGGTISLTASSNVAGSTYAWVGPNGFTSTQQNPFIAGASLAASGTYTVTITGNGCATTASTIVTVALMASALNFDGVDDYISVPFTPSVDLKTFTVETWINPTTSITPVQNIVSNASRASNNGFKFPKTNDGWTTFSFELSVDNQWQTVSAPFPASALGQWNHLAATYDGYFMKMYLNGALVAISEVAGTFTNNTNNLIIGNQDGVAEYFKGSIDELRIWSRAQSQCEIINNMKTCELNGDNNGMALQTGLSAYYRLNQGLINVSNAAVTTAADSSGHANDGTLYNFNLNGTASNWVQGKVNGVCDYFPQPLLSASANGSAFQVGSTVKLFAVNGNGSYSWDGPNSFASIDSTPVIPNVQQIQAGTYTVSTPYTNCVVTASTRFHITTASQIIANGPTNICPSASVTLSTASQGTSYQWYKNDVAIVGETNNQYVASQTGNYTVTITNAADITVSAPIAVTVIPDILAPVPDAATLPALTINVGATVTAIPTATDNCRGAVNGTANQSLTFNTLGTFTIVWTYDDLNGNTSVQNQQVTVLDNIPPVLTVPSNMSVQAVSGVCSAVANFTATATDNSGLPVNITYSINPGSVFALGVTTVNVTATDASNNSSSGSFIVTVTPATVAPITGSTTLCAGSTGTLSSATIGGSWSSNNAAVATVDAAGVVTALAAGTANISYTDVCGSSVTAVITVNPLPSVPVVTVADHCGTSTLSTDAAGSLLWSTVANTPSITVNSAGTYSVTQTVGGCTSAAGSAIASPMALPATPVITVADHCGTSTLSTSATGSLLWSTGAATSSITVAAGGTYTVTQTVNGCVSAAGSGTAAPNAIPSAPVVTVADNCGNSLLSTNAGGSLFWSTGATTSSITVITGSTYTVTQTVNGCVSAAGSGTAAPNAIPSTPVVTVADHCGTSILSTNAAGTLVWNTGANTPSITVSSTGTYSVTQTVAGCTSAAGSGNASPIAIPSAPVVTVADNCGTSTLSTGATGSLLWSTGENTSSITVSSAGAYTVTQTINGCTSTAGSGTAAPKAVASTPVITVVNHCGSSTLSTNAGGSLLWSNNATTSAIDVTDSGNYSVTVTNANGCSAASTVTAVSVNTIPVVAAITGATTVTAGSATQLSDASAGGVWTSSNPAIATVSASGLVTGVTAGSATITYTVTGAGGCSTAVTATVTVNPSCVTPVFTAISNISVNAVSGCAAPVTYTTSVTGNPALTYTFSGATTGTGSGSGSGAGFNLGTTTVVITAHNACGTVSTSFSVTVMNAAPVTAAITPATADAFCNSVVLTGNANAAAYQWVSPNGTTYANTAQISLGQGNAEGVYHLYVTGANGCISSTGADYNYQRQNLVNSYTILAFSKVQLGNNNTVNGGVGVTSPWGYVGLGSYTNITAPGSFVKAANISTRGWGVNVTNLIHSAAAGITLPTMYYNTAGTKKLPEASVKENTVTTLNGNYGELSLKKGSVTTLTGNIFGSIKVEQGAQVIFASSATVNIDELEVDKGPRNGYTYIRFSQDTKVLISSHVSISSNCFVNPDNNKVTFYLGDASPDEEKFTVKGGDTKVNANVYVPKGAIKVTGGYQYGDYGGGHSDQDDEDDDRYNAQGNAMVYMTGFYIADQVSSEGKNVVWNTFDCSAAPVSVISTATSVQQVTAKTATSEIPVVKASTTEEELKITVMPNPSTTYFTLKFESKYETPVNMRVMDASGRVVDAQSKIGSNSTIQIGASYASGTYYAEMIQGTHHKVVQLLKIR